MNPESPRPTFSTELKNLLLTCSGQLKLLYHDKPDETVKVVNETLDKIELALKIIDADSARLLPLIEGSPNERLANMLGSLLTDDVAHAEDGARASLMILTGIQAYLDSNGDPRTFEAAWGPVIVARNMLKQYGPEAWQIAAKVSGEMKAENKPALAEMYERVALMLAPEPDVKTDVDKPT